MQPLNGYSKRRAKVIDYAKESLAYTSSQVNYATTNSILPPSATLPYRFALGALCFGWPQLTP